MTRRSSFLLVLALALAVLPATGTGSSVQAAPAAPATDRLFEKLPDFTLPGGDDWIRPERFTAYDVALGAVAERLAAAPTARAEQRGATPTRINLPDPTGRLVAFDVVEDSIMEPGLAAAHPEITTYAGRAVQDPTQTARLDVTPFGFHASVRTLGSGRAWYVDPAVNEVGTTEHLSYYAAALPAPAFEFDEKGLNLLEGEEEHAGPEAPSAGVPLARTGPGGPVALRTYRLALATDPTYAKYFDPTPDTAGDNDDEVLAAKVTLMNRVNQLYMDDFGIKMVLVEGTDTLLNFDTYAEASGPNGPCGVDPCYAEADIKDGCTGALLTSNEFALGQVLGADSFDIGHIGLGLNGGGVARLGVVGEPRKAGGCTGLPFPTGDFYAIDYVAHEMGHQFNGNHTFNGTDRACDPLNRNGATAVEPGSGSSVMAYAGICAQDDLQPHTDPYFSQESLDEVDNHVDPAPSSYSEEQVVTLRGFDTDGDSVNLAYRGRTTTIVRGASYNGVELQRKIEELTGEEVETGGYNGDPLMPNDGGFYVAWSDTADHPRIQVTGGEGATGFLGVRTQGGAGNNDGDVTATGNRAPTVTAPAAKSIPTRTPFTLTGSGTDADGDPLVYLWEQNDVPVGGDASAGTKLTDPNKPSGPLFRVFGKAAIVPLEQSLQYGGQDVNLADGSSTRTFPDLDQVLAGNTNAESGTCPAPAPGDTTSDLTPEQLECWSEFLPTSNRVQPITLRLTARDLAPVAGGTQFAETVLTVVQNAGPFLVTSQSDGAGVVGGRTGTVTWNVAGTNTAALAQNVKISLSTDGGQTYPTVLVATTPNDGSQAVTWPNVTAEKARVKVEAVDNYFFDLSNADFPIQAGLEVAPVEPQTAQHSDPLDDATTFTVSSGDADGDELAATLTGVAGLTATLQSTSADGVRPGTATYAVSGAVQALPGVRTATITATHAERTVTRTFPVTVRPEDATVEYTGANTFEADTDPEPVALRAQVTQVEDGTAGDVTRAQVEFVDRGSDEVLCTADVAADGAALCLAALDVDTDPTSYVIGSRVVGAFTRDSVEDDETVVLTSGDAPGDTRRPQTFVTSGPRTGSIVADREVTFGLDSDEDGATYHCWLDEEPVPCTDSVTFTDLGSGTHRFTAVATDAANNTDTTPVTRKFAVAFDDRVLRAKTGGWARRTPASAFDQTLTQTRKDGQVLVRRVVGVTKLALVVNRGPRMGKLAVYLNGKRIRTVNLRSDSLERTVVVPVSAFRTARTLRVRLETVGNRRVQVDGIGVYGR